MERRDNTLWLKLMCIGGNWYYRVATFGQPCFAASRMVANVTIWHIALLDLLDGFSDSLTF
uniref:hypothetical protein n=1 Tax=Salmonella sp. TaxID=599 RepID=UPI001CD93E38|nr:hypothetical protein [Salmonella sp.]